jgi:hypothetical protein
MGYQSILEQGAKAKSNGLSKSSNPYRGHREYREDRIDQEVHRRQWDAGYDGAPDPYPNGYFV